MYIHTYIYTHTYIHTYVRTYSLTYVHTHIPIHIHLLYIEFMCAKQHKLCLTLNYLATGPLSSTSQYQLLMAHSAIVSHFLEMSFSPSDCIFRQNDRTGHAPSGKNQTKYKLHGRAKFHIPVDDVARNELYSETCLS